MIQSALYYVDRIGFYIAPYGFRLFSAHKGEGEYLSPDNVVKRLLGYNTRFYFLMPYLVLWGWVVLYPILGRLEHSDTAR